MDAINGSVVLYGALGSTWLCIATILGLYDLWAVVKYAREDSDEKASMIAWAAFALAVCSILPFCGGCFLAVIPLVLANLETRRIYRGDAALRGAGLARAASLTAGVVIVLNLLAIIASAAMSFAGGSV